MIETLPGIAIVFAAVAVLSTALTVWTLYDILGIRDDMEDIQKLTWVIVVLFLNIIGVILYYIIEKR